jgi:glutaminase
METEHERDAGDDTPFVSTGELPPAELARQVVLEAYERYRSTADGAVSKVYPALARVPADLFGICVVSTNGAVFSVGDAEVEFAIMSVAKPFVFALVCQSLGPEEARRLLGVNSTGLAFNSLTAIERSGDGRTNPMVNPGAIAAASLVPGATAEAKWEFIRDGISRFAGRSLSLDEETYASASETNSRNQSIARLLQSYGRIDCDPAEATDVYTRQSCLNVTATDLAVMGSTLADGGVNPQTGERVIDATTCRYTLAVMATAGLYETSGDWLYDVGLPGKSGIGGGIVTVAPGKGGLGTFAPRLDQAGNSVRGQLAARLLSKRLGLDIFLSGSAA